MFIVFNTMNPNQACNGMVSSAAVIRVVTQRFSPTTWWGEALRDAPNNGCGGD